MRGIENPGGYPSRAERPDWSAYRTNEEIRAKLIEIVRGSESEFTDREEAISYYERLIEDAGYTGDIAVFTTQSPDKPGTWHVSIEARSPLDGETIAIA